MLLWSGGGSTTSKDIYVRSLGHIKNACVEGHVANVRSCCILFIFSFVITPSSTTSFSSSLYVGMTGEVEHIFKSALDVKYNNILFFVALAIFICTE